MGIYYLISPVWNNPLSFVELLFPHSNQMVLEGTANHIIQLPTWLCHRLGQL